MICNLCIGLNKSGIAFNHEIYTAFISSPLPTRFSRNRLGPLQVIKLLNKIQENAYFMGFK